MKRVKGYHWGTKGIGYPTPTQVGPYNNQTMTAMGSNSGFASTETPLTARAFPRP